MHSSGWRHLPGTRVTYSSGGTTGGSVRVTSTTDGTSRSTSASADEKTASKRSVVVA